MKIKILIAVVILSCLAGKGFTQTVLLEEKVKDYSILEKRGPNLKLFDYMTIGAGFLLPVNDTTANILFPSSWYFTLGYRHKTKINNYVAVGFDVNFNYSEFTLKQDSRKTIPDSIQHNKQCLDFYKFGLGAYIRFNFDKRGNHMGKYLDLGAMADATISATNYTKDFKDGYTIKTYNRGMKPYETFNYNLIARLGFNKVVISASYRMLSVYKESEYKKGTELPPLSVGLELALF
jgi:hypothetical protein